MQCLSPSLLGRKIRKAPKGRSYVSWVLKKTTVHQVGNGGTKCEAIPSLKNYAHKGRQKHRTARYAWKQAAQYGVSENIPVGNIGLAKTFVRLMNTLLDKVLGENEKCLL